MALLWFILACAGQAAALRLVDAGTAIHYQHYAPLGRAWAEHPLALSLLALQAVLAGAVALAHRRAARQWLGKRMRAASAVAALAVLCAASATLSRSAPFYFAELLFASAVQLAGLANVVLAAAALPESWRLRFHKRWEQWLGGSNRLVAGAAVWVVLAAACFNVWSYQRHPHLADEVVYLAHARYLAAGMLAMPAPPVRDAFNLDLMTYDADKWYCPVPPGWPLALAAGVLAGVPWLVNPVLGGIGVVIAFLFLRDVYDARTARFAALLLGVSPWYVFLSMSFMNHCLALDLALAAAIAVRRAAEGRAAWALAAGAAVGALSLVRPLDAAIVAALMAAWILLWRRLRLTALAGLVGGCAATAATVLPYNARLTGSPLASPMQVYIDRYYAPGANALGFGANRGLGWQLDPYPGHGLRDVVVNVNLNLTTLNTELFGWGAGSLLFVAVLLFSGGGDGRDRFMVAAVLATVAAYSLYWFSGGPDFGPRYWFLIVVPCVALTARGIGRLSSGYAVTAALMMTAIAAVTFYPWRTVDKYRNYLGMRPDVRDLAARHAFGRSLVLVRGERLPDYMSAAVYNAPDLGEGGPVYAWDRDPDVRRKVVAAYRDRPVWLVNGPSVTGGSYAIAAGPLPAESLLQ